MISIALQSRKRRQKDKRKIQKIPAHEPSSQRLRRKKLGDAEDNSIAVKSLDDILKSPALYAKDYKERAFEAQNEINQINQDRNPEQRNELKREFVKRHQVYVEKFLFSNVKKINLIVSYYCVYLYDNELSFGGDWINEFFKWLPIAINQRQATPGSFKSDLSTFFGDSALDWCTRQYDAGSTPRPYLDTIINKIKNGLEVPIPLQAKFYKLNALVCRYMDPIEGEKDENIIKAIRAKNSIPWFEKAVKTYAKVGVKTELEKTQKIVEKADPKWFEVEAEPAEEPPVIQHPADQNGQTVESEKSELEPRLTSDSPDLSVPGPGNETDESEES